MNELGKGENSRMYLRQQIQQCGVNILFGGIIKWQNHYLSS